MTKYPGAAGLWVVRWLPEGKGRKGIVVARKASEGGTFDPAASAFGDLLRWHMRRGTRPGRSSPRPGDVWSAKTLAFEVNKTARTIQNWINGATRPNSTELGLLEATLFGDAPGDPQWPAQFRDAWDRAVDSRELHLEWDVPKAVQLDGTVALELFPPVPENENPDILHIPATLRFSPGPHEDPDSQEMIVIVVEEAWFTLKTDYKVLDEGGDDDGNGHVKRVAGGGQVIGPLEEGVLSGFVELGRALARVMRLGGQDSTVVVEISAFSRRLQVLSLGPDGKRAMSPNRDAVLKAKVFDVFKRDGQGRVVVATARAVPKRVWRS